MLYLILNGEKEMKLFNSSKKRMLGQGMTEYIIIVALIAIAAIGVFSSFGNVVRGQVGAMAAELGGESGKTANNNASQAGKKAAADGAKKADLKNFSDAAREGAAN
jgi:Flp pilus assembly pilin Flp